MKIAILGFAREGQAAYQYWDRYSNELTICDMNEQLEVPAGAEAKLGPDHLKGLDEFDLLVRTAVLKPKDIVAANPEAPNILDKVTTNINEFLKVCPTKNVVGVTGTKGKGTTSTLIAKMLEADGKKVHLGGNIGIAPLEMLKNDIQPDDWVVLEEGAFQLIDQKYSPHIAVCLMIAPEHMDWYEGDLQAYIDSKKNLFAHQKPDDFAIYLTGNDYSQQIAGVSPGRKIPYFAAPGALVENDEIKIDGQTICNLKELKLLGQHNWQNICAALTAVWPVTQNVEAIRSVLTSFTGLEHRLEFVREYDGVKYYDDSFGTTPETALVAVQAFEQPKILILGGSDKGSDFNNLADLISKSNMRQVILIGNSSNSDHPTTTPKIETTLKNHHVDKLTSLVKPGGATMAEIVQTARAAAMPGDIVLLSAGSASFDMFRDYKDRGDQFKQAALALV